MVRPPYVAVIRLFVYAERHWAAIDGEAASRGHDYLGLSIDRFCNVVQWWVIQRVKEPERFVAELERPLGGTEASTPTERELEADAQNFMAFATAFGVTPPKRQATAV